MPIRFVPDPGTVLICDYTTGFIPPEMVKLRRVVVISPKWLNNRGISTVRRTVQHFTAYAGIAYSCPI